jgi:hypothetical protein
MLTERAITNAVIITGAYHLAGIPLIIHYITGYVVIGQWRMFPGRGVILTGTIPDHIIR